MRKTLDEIEKEVMSLSTQDRAILAEHLLASLDQREDVDTEELWLMEAERRYQDYRAGKITARPAHEVFESAVNRLK